MENKELVSLYDAKISLINGCFLQNSNDVNLIKLLSLMSIFFKEKFQNDKLIQYLEVNILRPNSYRITDFHSLIQTIEEFISQFKSEEEKQIVDIFLKIFTFINDGISNIENDDKTAENIVKLIDNSVCEQKDLIDGIIKKLNEPKQCKISADKKKIYTLSPTDGIMKLNNNPYSFFVSKVLDLKPIDEWNNAVNPTIYGTIIHQIMENFGKRCKAVKSDINNNFDSIECLNLEAVFNEILADVLKKNKIKMNSFLRQKFEKVSKIAVDIELNAIKNNHYVFIEQQLQTFIDGVRIYAKADRIEIDYKNKFIYIFDYKTGTIPSEMEEKNGSKPQLLVIAMLILNQPKYSGFVVKKMEYVDLSGKAKQENITINVENIENVEKNIKKQVETYFENGYPKVENMKYIKQSGMLYENDYAIMKFYREKFIS